MTGEDLDQAYQRWRSDPELRTYTVLQFLVLRRVALGRKDKAPSRTEIQRAFGVSPAAISKVIEKLALHKCLEAEPGGRSSIRLRITPAGLSLHSRLEEVLSGSSQKAAA